MGQQSEFIDTEAAHLAWLKPIRKNDVTLLSIQKMYGYAIEKSVTKAIKEIRRNPCALGPEQRFLMNDPIEDGGYEWDSTITTMCAALDIDYPTFRDRLSDLLDKLAEKVILDPELYQLKTPEKDDDDSDDERETAIVLQLFMDLPVHTAPQRDVIRSRRPKPITDARQTDLLTLLAA